eukprot:TRINITY_DN32460_c0_g1_i1.p1 TRINITY_DN32460_c0_g1~~TRINITY_DN32460_c0_g1_i1.p1  ORF type:complete len:419 (-),score=32.24 TRINITY_DN32460_c0_g1_i1:5-1204(-)
MSHTQAVAILGGCRVASASKGIARGNLVTLGGASSRYRFVSSSSLLPFPRESSEVPAWLEVARSSLPSLDVRLLESQSHETDSLGQTSSSSVIVLGARHDCSKAPAEVAHAIKVLQPGHVGVELCDRRYRRLLPLGVESFERLPHSSKRKIRAKLRRGGEQLEAIVAAHHAGAKLILCDRDVRVTERRLLAYLPIHSLESTACAAVGLPDFRSIAAWLLVGWRFRRFCLTNTAGATSDVTASLVSALPSWTTDVLPEEALSSLSDIALKLKADVTIDRSERWKRMQKSIEEAVRSADWSAKVQAKVESELDAAIGRYVIEERDALLCDNLWTMRSPMVVAVVGVAHLDGLERRWLDYKRRRLSQSAVNDQLSELMRSPTLSLWRRVIGQPFLWRLRGTL